MIHMRPILVQVRSLIKRHKDHDPEISHVELNQSEWTKLCAEMRELYNSNEPQDTACTVIVEGVHIRRVKG